MLLLLVFTRDFQMMNNELEQMNNGLISVLCISDTVDVYVPALRRRCNKISKRDAYENYRRPLKP